MSLVGVRAVNHPQQVGKRKAKDAVDDRETLPEHFAEFDRQYGPFTLDVAAAPHNAKVATYYDAATDGLIQPWTGRVWCNPPYSDLNPWLEKAWAEWLRDDDTDRPDVIVMLLPANRTEQKWWQAHVEPYRDGRRGDSTLGDMRVRFLPNRMRFIRPDAEIGPKGDRPPFGNCLLIWQRPQSPPPVAAVPVHQQED